LREIAIALSTWSKRISIRRAAPRAVAEPPLTSIDSAQAVQILATYNGAPGIYPGTPQRRSP
jgi:hypothetical protein